MEQSVNIFPEYSILVMADTVCGYWKDERGIWYKIHYIRSVYFMVDVPDEAVAVGKYGALRCPYNDIDRVHFKSTKPILCSTKTLNERKSLAGVDIVYMDRVKAVIQSGLELQTMLKGGGGKWTSFPVKVITPLEELRFGYFPSGSMLDCPSDWAYFCNATGIMPFMKLIKEGK